jgi:hypothetical protein
LSKQDPISPQSEVRDPVILAVSHFTRRFVPDAVLAVVLMAIIGFGGGFLEWSRYNGSRVNESSALSAVGLFAICWALVRLARWAIKAGRTNTTGQ